MANKRVTDLETIATAPISGVMHFVDTTDSTQNAAGSSFKVTKEDFLKENTAAILLNTSKVGFTDALVGSAPTVTANTAKVGITTGQASAIVINTAKVSFDSTSSTRLANTSGTNTGDQDISIKQNTLVSATNIKTVNGNSLLGSGDLSIVTSGGITGSGTVNKLSKFTASGVVGDSLIFDNASNVGIGTTTPPHNLTLSSPNSSTELGLYNTNTASASNRNWLIGTTYQNFGDLNFFVSNIAGGNPKASPPKISISTAGRVMIGTSVDNGTDALQVNGTISATPATSSNQVVVKSQLDLKANDSDVVKLTGAQNIEGDKTFANDLFINNGSDTIRISKLSGANGRLVISRPNNILTESVSFGGGNDQINIQGGLGQIRHGGANFEITNTTTSGALVLTAFGSVVLRGASNAIGVTMFSNTRNTVFKNGGTFVDNGVDIIQGIGSISCTTLKTSGFTVATLPTPPAQGEGARAHVTDASNPTYLGALTGGGTVKCPVFYNGTAWVSA